MTIHGQLLALLVQASEQPNNKAKVSFLQRMKSWPMQELLKYILDPQKCYYMTAKTMPEPSASHKVDTELHDMFRLLNSMAEGFFRDAEGKAVIANFLANADSQMRTLFKWAIDRQLPGKIGKTLINKAFNGLIYDQPYGGVSSYDAEKIETRFNWAEGVLLQEKADGLSLFLSVDPGGDIAVHTRQGQDVTSALSGPLSMVFNLMPIGKVLHCEGLLIDGSGQDMPRRTANGLYNKLFQGTVELDPWQFKLKLLDMIDYNYFYRGHDDRMCGSRLGDMADFCLAYERATDVNREYPLVDLVERYTVHSVDEARGIAKTWINAGREGGVLKDPTAPWKNTRMTSQMKLKNEFECTLTVVDWVPHKKKPLWVGSLVCRSDSGTDGNMIETKVGSGLNEDINSDLTRVESGDFFIGKCIEVKAECITNKNALSLPRITGIRFDKEHPDTYDEVVAAYNDSIALDDVNNC